MSEKSDKVLLQIETDELTLDRAETIFNQLGIDVDTAVNIFLRHVVLNRGFPFDITKIVYRPDQTNVSQKYLMKHLVDQEINEALEKEDVLDSDALFEELLDLKDNNKKKYKK